MQQTWEIGAMENNAGTWATAGGILTGLAALGKAIMARKKRTEPTAGIEELTLQAAVGWLKAAVLRIEALVADVPSMKDQISDLQAQGNRFRTVQQEHGGELATMRRDNEIRDEFMREVRNGLDQLRRDRDRQSRSQSTGS